MFVFVELTHKVQPECVPVFSTNQFVGQSFVRLTVKRQYQLVVDDSHKVGTIVAIEPA